MGTNKRMDMNDFLKQGVNGGNLLFCGAGFSADCLNFSENSLGTLSPLLKELNDKLDYDYDNIQYAADEYSKNHGQNGLLKLLQKKYSVSHRVTDVDDILKYPWDRIYTTNYDDVISQSLTTHRIKHCVLNNTDVPSDVNDIHDENTKWVVHLHGAIKHWNNIPAFEKSCVLGRKSYMELGVNSKWLPTFKKDYAKANGVFFIGFSNNDFYFAQELYSALALQDKVFFINAHDSKEDKNLQAAQEGYGESHSIGKEHFANIVRLALKNKKPETPVFSNFELCKPIEPSEQKASVDQQSNFFISGMKDNALLYHDVLYNSRSYRFKRKTTDEVIDFFKKDNSVGLVLGGLCSGKTTILDECIIRFRMDGNKVFRFKTSFNNLLQEVKIIIKEFPNSVVVIDDCFGLKDSIRDVIKIFNESGHKLLLASRTLAYDFEEDLRSIIDEKTPFKTFDTEILSQEEGEDLIDCADRMGIWGKDVKSSIEKQEILERDNHSRLSSFLLHIFKSKVVKDRFVAELDKMKAVSVYAEKALIVALYLRNINSKVEERVLSELIQKDAVNLFKDFDSNPFISYIPLNREFNVIPGVNAREALNSFFDAEIVTNTIVEAVAALEDVRNEPPFNYAFTQMMRYTQFKQVVKIRNQQNIFFDRLSELKFCRDHRFFWLQWSMAMRDQEQWRKAFQFLDEAYGRAKQQNRGTLPLDDQMAGLLLDSTSENCSSGDAVKRFRDASTLLINSINISKEKVTSHNYLTIKSFDVFFQKVGHNLSSEHKKLLEAPLSHLKKMVKIKLKNQPENSYIKTVMNRSIVSIDRALDMLQTTEKTHKNNH